MIQIIKLQEKSISDTFKEKTIDGHLITSYPAVRQTRAIVRLIWQSGGF